MNRAHSLLLAALLAPSTARADPVVDAFVAEVVANAESHAWTAVLEHCEEAHRNTQIGMGIKMEQYVAEIFGLHTVGNSIARAHDGIDDKDLDRLHHFVVTEVLDVADDGRGNRFDARGTVDVKGGTPLKFTLEIVVRPDGQLRLTGAVG
jgi:hypothetical protein